MTESKHAMLTTWERCVDIANINKDKGGAAAQDYLESFNELDQAMIKHTLMQVSMHGKDVVWNQIKNTMEAEKTL